MKHNHAIKSDSLTLAAYGWPDPSAGSGLSDEEILARLLALNLAQAGEEEER